MKPYQRVCFVLHFLSAIYIHRFMQRRKYIFIFVFFILADLCSGQSTDSAQTLKEAVISSSRLTTFSTGTKVQVLDSAAIAQYKTGNLSDILAFESPLFIKSYGLGSLATCSFRGAGASHTATLWNGFNLNNPMYGQFDLSLFPVGFMDKVSVQYGGTSALWGSGAVGGAIHLSSEAAFDQGLKTTVSTSFGSFNSRTQNFQLSISKMKWISTAKFFNASATNNFPFYNTALLNSPKQIQSNAELKQYGLLSENYLKINEHQKLSLFFWYQFSNRNSPPLMLQQTSKANRGDESFRLSSEWQRVGNKVTYMLRSAWFDESLSYIDLASNVNSLSHSQTSITEAEAKITVNKKQLVNIGLNNTYAQATSFSVIPEPEVEGYLGKPSQNRLAGFASYRFRSENEKLTCVVSAREEYIQNKFVPFTYSGGIEYVPIRWLSARASASKVYRVPSFNDLYWARGGNSKLLPESGFCAEAGIELKLTSDHPHIQFTFEPTVFSRNMDNWIIWLPGAAYPSPKNILNVWSRGVETRSELKVQINPVVFKISVITNYVVSTNEEAITENDASVDKQLIYVPMYSGHGKVSVEYKNISLSYVQSYTGYRYTSTDNLEYLKPYVLANMFVSYKINFHSISLDVFIQANNLFNEQYQVLRNYAMPLVNYQAGLSIHFTKPNYTN